MFEFARHRPGGMLEPLQEVAPLQVEATSLFRKPRIQAIHHLPRRDQIAELASGCMRRVVQQENDSLVRIPRQRGGEKGLQDNSALLLVRGHENGHGCRYVARWHLPCNGNDTGPMSTQPTEARYLIDDISVKKHHQDGSEERELKTGRQRPVSRP